ncbi:ATP-dependent helicase HrpB [Cytophaga hutchinsonii]|uniref:ATP-dependent helicase n=1 Tax=Cytophaga hutchinsonii (strain ATCC 33406 / DSM 1761 / CIP 103989 / NBRC 15051 / NCIMB 9469 / D465) TaxID=269798 RepID=A0A6N4SVT7_CYTH3|nr:ATP-dependent helicase HrpB [Cytophaga hutchinsonii]ABG60350.1 ATP-dependent helicase [Cytophaga hutchinsonii ATCC 33406]SFX87679.1 ATP-dependent helicase HrpB [Cytophaga hutchinsonii ATCC 33406]
MNQYPIAEIVEEIKETLNLQTTVILQAPPGAGKSTILPLELLKADWLEEKKIILLEPRRMAARSVAQRMADLLGEEVGKTVGYRVRFDQRVSAQTRIEVVTEGILTRRLQQDNTLEGVGMVIFDEFHERSLHSDLSLALCRDLQQILREDLRILIMSATLDGENLSAILDKAPIITSKGRQYPIDVRYTSIDTNAPISGQITTVISKVLKEETGDILVFLPGVREIQQTAAALTERHGDIAVRPLYGELSLNAQQEAIRPDAQQRRKVVLATSIAETSLTIEGIHIVIDSGLARVPKFDPNSGMTKLETVKVTQDAADQRAGRAGRLGPGIAIRLWPEATQQYLKPQRVPEIAEADLAPLVLELAQWGVRDIQSMTWITAPPSGSVDQARTLLQELDAIQNGVITEDGKALANLPTHPRTAHLLLKGKEHTILPLAIDLVCILEERDALGKHAGADISLRVDALQAWRAGKRFQGDTFILERIERAVQSWRKIFSIKSSVYEFDTDSIGLLIAAAYPERIARLVDAASARYRMANSRNVRLHENDVLVKEEWLAVAHADAGVGEGRIYWAAALNPMLLTDRMVQEARIRWDETKGVLLQQEETRIGSLTVTSKPLKEVDETLRAAALCEAVRKEGLKIFNWDEACVQWQARILSLKQWRPTEAWPNVDAEGLLQTLEDWLPFYLKQVKRREDFKKIPLPEVLHTILPWEQAKILAKLAPTHIDVPSGSSIALEYKTDGSFPVLSVRLQELFGLTDTPTVNEGRTKVMIHLLSPGYKPVQVTQDLKSFWANTYPEVRKELRMRYPKHSWPEDPWNAEAVRGVKRKNS